MNKECPDWGGYPSRIGGNKFAEVNKFSETTTTNVSDKIRVGLGANEILYGDGTSSPFGCCVPMTAVSIKASP
jgi:hypothetical protein